ncbi:3-oxoacyl-ACP reductase [Phycicoccus endophyticus]|uniref:3-oxoacyl-ACP reductase n=1 Tax=Phycicoccus endophyticus TaxID=1690220 RepID=A0A7G9R4Q9_9MICO|nr:3-oxoacyl-ACP reductase [Phycicoccus endophyticus]NHI18498.1 3-oxoacyl-ACP reductase [Phycicoccus endophyticus]QNN50584.1 3-oxoacyl-ACP reductase [Phycicoccus endophyticus]GGL23324.1 3-oxoacyl-ACP reductase [Phycicoccus endophyticus]
MARSDRYTAFVNTGVGARLATSLGLPRPVPLRRYTPGQPVTEGQVLVGGHGDTPAVTALRGGLTAAGVSLTETPPEQERLGGVVLDLTAAETPADLESLRATLAPALRRLGRCARVVVVGRDPRGAGSPAQRAARRALEGVTRSVAKELREGATANLVLTGDGHEAAALGTVLFFLSARSAYVDGQVVRVGDAEVDTAAESPEGPLTGKVAVVTGAARGIGADIARTLARDGATLVCVDVPAAGAQLAQVANEVGGTALQLDVTSEDAGARILDHARTRHGGLDVVVHNAGITRDKLLANTDADRWGSVLQVNLLSILRMNEALLAKDGLRDGGRVVLVSSIAGIAGNRGQSSYAASKAGVIGLVDGYSCDPGLRRRGVTVNAVAPGFIETEMTARIPLATREVGRRLSSLAQGGLPVDVAETIAYFAADAQSAVSGNVLRVCGQSLLGA